MAILGSSFQIARSALAAYQSAISISGQNIANVGNPNYTRQTGRLGAIPGGQQHGIAAGNGVNLVGVQRHVDEAVEARLRSTLAQRNGAELSSATLGNIESLYNELTDGDLSSQLASLFASFGQLQTDPTDRTQRGLVLNAAQTVVGTLQRQRAGLLGQVADLNTQVETTAAAATSIADEIAGLNRRIVVEEWRLRSGVSALRDRRDQLLRELSEYVNIQTREQTDGSVNVYIGSEPIVEFDRSRGLATRSEFVDGVELQQLRFADDQGLVPATSGRLGALVTTRAGTLLPEVAKIDQLAQGLIYETNRVHADGKGLVGYGTLTGGNAVSDPAAALNSAAARLSFPVRNGTFLVRVTDTASGTTTTRQIRVDLDGGGAETSLAALAAALGTVPGVTATVTAENRLRVSVAAGSEISFAEDSSGALAALGVGAFFTGSDAGDIAVHAALVSDPRLIAASISGAPGDGDNAGRLAELGTRVSTLLGDVGVQDFHANMIGAVAITASRAANEFEAADVVYSAIVAQREAISGVSLDEEAIALTKFERSYQGAARFVNVVNTLSQEVLNLLN